MCDCGKNSCKSCGSAGQSGLIGQLSNDLSNVIAILNNIEEKTKWLNGHPILALDNPDDIASFDASSGEGFGSWIGWGVCNGNTYVSPKGNISTPDLRDRFLTGVGGTYVVGDTGGENTHALSESEMPTHTHVLTDPGHTHTVADLGHTHTISDPGHTHTASSSPHQHSFTTDSNGLHEHDVESYDSRVENNDGLGDRTDVARPGGTRTTTSNGDHSHTGTTDPTSLLMVNSVSTTGVTNNSSATGVTNNSSTTGISMSSKGGGAFHENRPPYYACLFVKKIF